MNAHQRRKYRRARGIRLPAKCGWCGAAISRWDSPCECFTRFGVHPRRPRRVFGDLTLQDFYREGIRRGLDVQVILDAAPPPLTSVATFAEVLDSAAISAHKAAKE